MFSSYFFLLISLKTTIRSDLETSLNKAPGKIYEVFSYLCVKAQLPDTWAELVALNYG